MKTLYFSLRPGGRLWFGFISCLISPNNEYAPCSRNNFAGLGYVDISTMMRRFHLVTASCKLVNLNPSAACLPCFGSFCCHVRVRFPEMRRRNPEDLGRLANGIPRERYFSTYCVPRGRCGVWGAKRSSTADFGSEMLVVGWFDGWRVRDICRNEDSQSFCRNGREASGKPYGMSPVFFLAFRGPLYHFFLRFSVVCR